jgi:hypothetical protein
MTNLGEISHTNPYTDESFGRTQVYARGRTVVADGGHDPDREDDADAEQLKDIEHEPPEGAESAQEVYERGVTEDGDDV